MAARRFLRWANRTNTVKLLTCSVSGEQDSRFRHVMTSHDVAGRLVFETRRDRGRDRSPADSGRQRRSPRCGASGSAPDRGFRRDVAPRLIARNQIWPPRRATPAYRDAGASETVQPPAPPRPLLGCRLPASKSNNGSQTLCRIHDRVCDLGRDPLSQGPATIQRGLPYAWLARVRVECHCAQAAFKSSARPQFRSWETG